MPARASSRRASSRKSAAPSGAAKNGHDHGHGQDGDDERGGRPFWSGVLSFGLVSIPVDLLPAQRSSGGSLRMLDADGTPLARRFYCPVEQEEIAPEHIVRGYELDDGKVVTVSDEELERLAPKKSREIDLRRFVPLASLDPLYFERGYFLAPGSESGKAYRLLASVMERSGRAGIATFVMRDREYLVAIFAEGGLLRAETLRFAGEVRSSARIGLPRASKAAAQKAAAQKAQKKVEKAVSALEQSRWQPSTDGGQREEIRKLAEAKLKKKQDVVHVREQSSEAAEPALDLMEVLRKSLAESGIAANGTAANDARPRSRGKARRSSARGSSRRTASPRRAPRARQKAAARRPRQRRQRA